MKNYLMAGALLLAGMTLLPGVVLHCDTQLF